MYPLKEMLLQCRDQVCCFTPGCAYHVCVNKFCGALVRDSELKSAMEDDALVAR